MTLLKTLSIALAVLPLSVQAAESAPDRGTPVPSKPVEMTVYRSPTCSCCGRWLEHMKKNGFLIKDIKTTDMESVKSRYGVPDSLQSCHTALVSGYVVEGHVPAGDVAELLKKRPRATGLTVPGMPMGTPGMEMGGKADPFAVLEFDKDGTTRVFHEYGAK
jgi:hypothetical protein